MGKPIPIIGHALTPDKSSRVPASKFSVNSADLCGLCGELFSVLFIRRPQCYPHPMYAQKFPVEVLIGGERRPCPLEWLDQFSMRNFTNSADFDDAPTAASKPVSA